MKIEHVAFQVPEPAAAARWYADTLGFTIRRAEPEPPFGHFLADGSGTVMLEFYNNPRLPVPDYAAMDPVLLHVALAAADVRGTRERLIAAGARAEGDVSVNPGGDELAMLRDPWGLPIQLVRRKDPMIP
jgi:catechol 2,3-dioxygenase-like lactoylglutathione lyase family enzyme